MLYCYTRTEVLFKVSSGHVSFLVIYKQLVTAR